jgi:type II secretory pathway predicted ATPase ExeA
MTNFLVRPFALSEHPLRDRSYRLPTSAIEDLYALIVTALERRRTGIMAFGRSRMGKTTAIDYLVALLAINFPNLPVVVLRCRYKRVPSETAFFSNFLNAVRHKVTSGRDTEQLRQRLVQRMCLLADTNGVNQLLLFADEAQNLTRCEYEWLRDVHDDLHHWGKTLLVVLVGQPELKGEKTTFQRDGSMHIVSRFMVHELAFHGARSAEDCATCLQGYDLQEYPADSGWSHSRFAFPHAYASGLRFVDEGAAAWHAFDQAHKATLLPEKLEIGMEFFTAAVEHLMLTNAVHDRAEFRPSIELWKQAVKASGYVEATLSEVSPANS